MQKYDDYTITKKKALGAFYTPNFLADYLAKVTFSLCKFNALSRRYTVLDPATGDSSLLIASSKEAAKKGLSIRYCGIDIEDSAIERSKKYFEERNINAIFLHTDALYPIANETSINGWKRLINIYMPHGIDLIVCNPPWGAEKNHYTNLGNDFITAVGQFDIYDLFIENAINILNNEGCYGIIVPDSIYGKEHTPIRKFLLENTTIKRIVRLGEGIFPNINIAVSLIFGIKKKYRRGSVTCSHLSNALKKDVINSIISLESAVDKCATKVSQKLMISEGFNFLTDIRVTDNDVLNRLRHTSRIENVAHCHRGIELSKKGLVLKCNICTKWFPKPRSSKQSVTCPHCKSSVLVSKLLEAGIISNEPSRVSKSIIVGEDISRFKTISKSYIKTDVEGINYKDENIYNGPKILVRKTGVGITVGIDYDNCLTNQVVYILKRKNNILSSITNEVIIAVLNSRITTYYIIKTLGSNGWISNAYITQKNVLSLPFPIIKDNNETQKILSKITNLVKDNARTPDFPKQVDAEIEFLVSILFGLEESDYDVIYQAISGVQQMIPFKRLLKITKEDIYNNGI